MRTVFVSMNRNLVAGGRNVPSDAGVTTDHLTQHEKRRRTPNTVEYIKELGRRFGVRAIVERNRNRPG